MKTITLFFLFLIILICTGCLCSREKVYLKPNGKPYPYVACVINSENKDGLWKNSNGYTAITYVGCDSFQMVTPKSSNIWVEGKRMMLVANASINIASQTK